MMSLAFCEVEVEVSKGDRVRIAWFEKMQLTGQEPP